MLRTRIVALLASLVIATTGVVVAPGTAYAGGGTDETRNFRTWSTSDGGFMAHVSPDWKLGDCTPYDTFDRNNTTVKITPLPVDRATVIWHAVARTAHTTNGDIWRVTFHFRTAYGTEIVTTTQLRSPTMTANRTYIWEQSIVINVDPQLFALIFSVNWESTC